MYFIILFSSWTLHVNRHFLSSKIFTFGGISVFPPNLSFKRQRLELAHYGASNPHAASKSYPEQLHYKDGCTGTKTVCRLDSSGHRPRNGSIVSNGIAIFNLLRNFHTDFHIPQEEMYKGSFCHTLLILNIVFVF